MKTITNQVAEIMSLTARAKIDKFFEQKAKASIEKLKTHKDYADLKVIYSKYKKAQSDWHKAEKKIQSKYKVGISHYNGTVSVTVNKVYPPTTRTLKTELVIANQVEGIDPKNVVDYVVKKHTR